ncbi:unnamed protein product [Urochloa humidicola]
MMQRRRQHGSSGELDVFGATSYFAGGLPDFPTDEPAVRQLIQESFKVRHVTRIIEDDEQLELHDDERHAQLGIVAKPSSGKGKLAALLSFVVSPSPRASFRKESPAPPPPPASELPAAGDEPAKASSSSLSSRESSVQPPQGCGGGVHELDLGVATGDRRLQGVRVVRGSGEERRWVVRCSAWEEEEEEEHHERMLDDAGSSGPNKDGVEEGDDGNPGGGWESDSSSDLFDLDIEYLC